MSKTYPKPVVYLAGPMTGIKHFNVEQFLKTTEDLESRGYDVRNPAQKDIDGGFDPYQWDGTESTDVTGFDLEAALEWDLAQVRAADAVALLPFPEEGWVSQGVALELAEAEDYGVPVYRLKLGTYGYLLESTHGSQDQKDFPCRECSPELAEKPFGRQWKSLFPAGAVTLSQPIVSKDKINFSQIYSQSNAELDEMKSREAKVLASEPTTNPWTGVGEVRTVSSTGGEKGTKLARYDLIPVDALKQVAEHYGRGAEKYDDNQWRKGYEWSKSYAALIRHANQFWAGEDFDEETGSNHMAAVAWHALALLTFYKEFPDFDDRYKEPDDAE